MEAPATWAAENKQRHQRALGVLKTTGHVPERNRSAFGPQPPPRQPGATPDGRPAPSSASPPETEVKLEEVEKSEGPFDLVFLDADRVSYATYLELALPKLVPGGLLVADNVVSHAAELEDYVGRVKSHPELFSVTVPVGNGEEISYKLA